MKSSGEGGCIWKNEILLNFIAQPCYKREASAKVLVLGNVIRLLLAASDEGVSELVLVYEGWIQVVLGLYLYL
jgi:hypothetical protein